MNAEQFNELINAIVQLGESTYGILDLLRDVLISLFSIIVAAKVAYKVVEYQINRSEEQQREQRKEEIRNYL